LPLEQLPFRHEQPPQRADDGVGRNPRLMRKKGDRESDLLSARRRVLAHSVVVRPPGLVPRRRTRQQTPRPTVPRSRRARAASSGAANRQPVHPARRKASCASSSCWRRRLSRIFQRDSSASRFRSRPWMPGTQGVNHCSSCQSPRIQRCFRRRRSDPSRIVA
jgi:hypothetical protein